MATELRARARDDEDEEALVLALEEASVGDALERALAACDATAVSELLDAEVRALDGGPAQREGGLPAASLVRAGADASYRGAAAHTLARALGPSRVASVLAELVARAAERGTPERARSLVERFGASGPVAASLATEVLARGPAAASALEALRPGSLRLSAAEIREITKGGDAELEAALPRLVLGLPALDGKTRKSASKLVWRLADRHEPLAIAALDALLRAAVPAERKLEGVTPIERALEAGALEALRSLERAGARRPRRARTPAPVKTKAKASAKAGPTRGARPTPAPPPYRPWWRSEVRPLHVALGALAFALLAALFPVGAFLGLVAFSFVFLVIAVFVTRTKGGR